jgi:dolichol kinase
LQAATKHEINDFIAGPIFYALGIMLSLAFFPEPIGYASIMILTLGDGFSTLLGMKMGKHIFHYNKVKSFEGTFFGFIFAFAGALVFVSPLKALFGALLGMAAEILPSPVNDNLTIPIVAGITMVLIP